MRHINGVIDHLSGSAGQERCRGSSRYLNLDAASVGGDLPGRARRRWSEADKRRLVAETLAPGETVHGVARRHGVSTSQLFTWRKQLRAEIAPAVPEPVPGFAAVAIAPTAPSASEVAPSG